MKDKLTRLTGSERLGQERQSEYLGAEDIDPGTEPVLTISGLYNGMATLQRGKEMKDIITFGEKTVPGIHHVRPLIVNATNRKVLRKLYGDTTASTLEGKRIQLWVDHNVRNPEDGSKTDGIRIRPFVPKVQTETVPPCADCKGAIQGAGSLRTGLDMARYTKTHYGVPLCAACARKRAEAAKAEEVSQDAPAADS